MKQFFKFVFASCLGLVLAGLVLFAIIGIAAGSSFSSGKEAVKVKPNSILELTFDAPIPEKTNNLPRNPYEFDMKDIVGLHDMIAAIEKAKEDDNIKGIFINTLGASGGRAAKASMRDALKDFKESGKFVVAYSKYFTENSYYLASVADEIYLNPVGGMEFDGFGGTYTFYKNMIDKLGIKAQVFYVGDFKGATEPVRRTDLSAENRLQIREYIDALYANFLTDISESRGVSTNQLKRIANEQLIQKPADAVTQKLVDKVAYYDQAVSNMKEKMGLEDDDKLYKIGIQAYAKGAKDKNLKIKDRVAVVYAEGGISEGKSEPGSIGDETYMKILRKVRKDDKVKALVLRVNSGGGSALASDNIWREIELIKEKGIPVITSMADVAASGGYYIACNSDKIYAEANTITGSIGVFGVIPSFQKLFNEKMGITFDTVLTGPFAKGISLGYDINEAEGRIIQNSVENTYDTFLGRVATGRNMSKNDVHKIAQGRVWIGAKAKEIGLVDEIGSLEDAVTAAAKMADVNEYRLKEYPFTKDPIEQIMENIMGKKDKEAAIFMNSELKAFYPMYQQLKNMKNMKGVQARIPFSLEIN